MQCSAMQCNVCMYVLLHYMYDIHIDDEYEPSLIDCA